MSTKCVGYKHSKGSMYDEQNRRDINWNNHVFYCINDEDPYVSGFSSAEIKVPDEQLFFMTGFRTEEECKTLISETVEPIYCLVGDKIKLKYFRKAEKPVEFADPAKPKK